MNSESWFFSLYWDNSLIYERAASEAQKRNYRVPKDPGFIYAMWAQGSRYFKFGLSKDPGRRLKQVYPKMPFETHLVKLWPVQHMRFAEGFMHWVFRDSKANGEWFELSHGKIWALFEDMAQSSDCFYPAVGDDLCYAYVHHFMINVVGLSPGWMHDFYRKSENVDLQRLEFEISLFFRECESCTSRARLNIPEELQALIEQGDPDPALAKRAKEMARGRAS